MDVTYGVPYMSERLQKDFKNCGCICVGRGRAEKVKLLSAIPVGAG